MPPLFIISIMSAFSKIIEKIINGGEATHADYDLCNSPEQFDFLLAEVLRPAFITDVLAASEEGQAEADREKNEINAKNGYDLCGNIIAPKIPTEWM